MSKTINLGIVGFGNVGQGVLTMARQNPDMKVTHIVSRDPERTKKTLEGKALTEDEFNIQVVNLEKVNESSLDGVDVNMLCGGSKEDLPVQGPFFARMGIPCIDSFDTHGNIPPYFDPKTLSPAIGYFNLMDSIAKANSNVCGIALGWDPGTFSVHRALGEAFLPNSVTYAFYGLNKNGGLSMGHSDALRRIAGVRDGVQYTHAILETIERLRNGERFKVTPKDMHWRECFVVSDGNTDSIQREIVGMENYYRDYKTSVDFVTEEQLAKIREERGLYHDGLVLTVGETGAGNKAVVEYRNSFDSNPEGTAGIMLAHARAVYKMKQEGRTGAFTPLDFCSRDVSPLSGIDLLRKV